MAGTLDFPFSPDLHNSWLVEYVAVSNFPKLVFLKTGIPKNSSQRHSRTCCFQVCFGTLLVWDIAFFSTHGLLSIEVNVLVSCICQNVSCCMSRIF